MIIRTYTLSNQHSPFYGVLPSSIAAHAAKVQPAITNPTAHFDMCDNRVNKWNTEMVSPRSGKYASK